VTTRSRYRRISRERSRASRYRRRGWQCVLGHIGRRCASKLFKDSRFSRVGAQTLRVWHPRASEGASARNATVTVRSLAAVPPSTRRGNSSFVDSGQAVDNRTLLTRAPRRKGLLSVQLSRGSTTHHLPRVAGPTGMACQLLLSTRRCIDPLCVRIRCVERFSVRSVALHHSRGETNTTRFALSPHGYERVSPVSPSSRQHHLRIRGFMVRYTAARVSLIRERVFRLRGDSRM